MISCEKHRNESGKEVVEQRMVKHLAVNDQDNSALFAKQVLHTCSLHLGNPMQRIKHLSPSPLFSEQSPLGFSD